jgi:vacuolar protein sorting-associated protein 54
MTMTLNPVLVKAVVALTRRNAPSLVGTSALSTQKMLRDYFFDIYIGVAETLRRLTTQSRVLLDITCAIGNPDAEYGVRSPVIQSPIGSAGAGSTSAFEIQEEMHVALDLGNLLAQAVDASHERINRILRIRYEQTIGLPLAYFLRYFTLNLFFANECEAISGRAGTTLNTIVDSHIKAFIKAHGDRKIQSLARGMGADNWQEKDFSANDSGILEQILKCGTSDPPKWTEISKTWAPLTQEEAEMNDTAVPKINDTEALETSGAEVPETNSMAKSKVRGAFIEGETFLLPHSAILCLKGTSHFLRSMGTFRP